MKTIFMNSESSKTSYSHRLLLNLTDKINLKRKDKYVGLSNLSAYYLLRFLNLLQMHLKLLQKERFEKQQNQLVI